jgi:hypothetical protein
MLIGITGFKQSGKSTAAKYMEEHHGFVRLNFKDALIEEIKQNFPDLLKEIHHNCYPLVTCTDDLFTIKPPLIRTLMQNYGTEVRRREDPKYWIRQWQLKNAELHRQGKNVVVDDVRFINEAEAIRFHGGVIVRVFRPDILTGGDHQSEAEQLQIIPDYAIRAKKGEQEKIYQAFNQLVT